MDLWLTGAALLGGLTLAWGAARADRRPPRPGRGAFKPWPALMMLGATVALFAAAHLLTLAARGGD